MNALKLKLFHLLLPLLGGAGVLLAWSASSRTWSKNLPSPAKTWEVSKPYVVEPFEKRGELDQGILRFAWYSLLLVAKGYALALAGRDAAGIPARPVAALPPRASIRSSRSCGRCRRWPGCPSGLVLFENSKPAALFTIAICAMWPTVLNTAVGVRAIPQDYLNVARVLASPRASASSRSSSRPRCPTCSRASA